MKLKKPLRLLYVEDDFFVATAMQRNLEDRGYIVTYTASAREAIDLLRATKEPHAVQFDGVLTDFEILEGHGIQVAEEAIALGVPVRIMSGRTSPDAQWDSVWILKGNLSDLYHYLDSL